MPCRKLVVPSSGSMYQVALPCALPPVSSATMPNWGVRARRDSIMAASASRSAWETRSLRALWSITRSARWCAYDCRMAAPVWAADTAVSMAAARSSGAAWVVVVSVVGMKPSVSLCGGQPIGWLQIGAINVAFSQRHGLVALGMLARTAPPAPIFPFVVMSSYSPLVPPAAGFDAGGRFRSVAYGDVYHSLSGALGQAEHVFLRGNGLPQRWRGRQAFTVCETGFGLGLNFLALWDAWRNDPARPR